MSLTGHLIWRDSPVKTFLYERFEKTRVLTASANGQLRAEGCICPPPNIEEYPYADVGRAIDYRIRYFYPAGPIDDLVAWKHGHRILWERYTRLAETNPDTKKYTHFLRASVEFFLRVRTFIQTTRPEGRLLDPREEALLARYCYVLGVFELAYRTGDAFWFFSLWYPHTVDGWLAKVPQAAVGDLVRLARLFFQRQQNLLAKPVIMNPEFAGSSDVGGADADLIIDGCLVELKCSKREKLDTMWLRQLAGYVLLDYTDELHIHSIGIYMVRHGVLLSWPLDEFLAALSGDQAVDLAQLRSEFRDVCEAAEAASRPRPVSEYVLRLRERTRERLREKQGQ